MGILWVVLSALAMAGCGGGAPGDEFIFSAPGGQGQLFYDPAATRGRAPALAGESVTEPGRRVGTADYPGQVLVINVWGSWCGPCRAEADDLERVAAATATSGVQFLGIDVRDNRDAAADFIRDRGVTYPSIFDPPGRSLIALRGFPRNVVPSTIVLDRQHRVAAVFLRALLDSDLLPVVRRIAAEPTVGPAGSTAPTDGTGTLPGPAVAGPSGAGVGR